MKYFTEKEMGVTPLTGTLLKFRIIQIEARDRSGAYYGPSFTSGVTYLILTQFDGALVSVSSIVRFIELYNQIYTVPLSMKIEGQELVIWIEH